MRCFALKAGSWLLRHTHTLILTRILTRTPALPRPICRTFTSVQVDCLGLSACAQYPTNVSRRTASIALPLPAVAQHPRSLSLPILPNLEYPS